MKMNETEMLREELKQYKHEKERVRKILSQIGGATTKNKDTAINVIFITLIIFLFAFGFMREILVLPFLKITSFFSIEMAILLVSIKIIWMIYRQ
jgi:hypothetical protein